MKNQIVMLLCTAVLTVGLAAAPAMASDAPYRPVEVEAYTYGPLDEPRVNKVYRLPAAADPSGIPTEDFERGGWRYYLLDMIADNADREVITYTVIFGSVELAGASGQFAPYETDRSPDLLPLLVCTGCMAMAAVMALCNIKTKQFRRKSI